VERLCGRGGQEGLRVQDTGGRPLLTTAEDYARFLEAILRDERLEPKTAKSMRTLLGVSVSGQEPRL